MAKDEPGFTLIKGARIADASLRRAAPGDVLIKDGTIIEVGASLDAPADARIVDASGMLIHPGLINGHTHGHGGLGRGMGDKWTLELLLAAAPWIGGNRALADKKLATQVIAAEMVLKGCTAAYDLYAEVPLPTVEGMNAAAEAYAGVGMRAVIAPMVADTIVYDAIPGLFDALPESVQQDVSKLRLPAWERTLEAMQSVAKSWRWGAEDIRFAIAPTIPHHCSNEFLNGCACMAKEHGLQVHTHVGESKVQAIVGLKRYGKTLFQHMDSMGLVNEKFTAAHAIWLDDDDMRLAADRGASLVHNPGSNMRLGNGMFALRRALDLGVNVGLGTDGANCSDNQNMYEAMRYASMMSKVRTPDHHQWATTEECYKAATLGSARALGFGNVGAIAPGMKADIVFLTLGHVNWIPHNGTVNQLVHAEDGTAVRHVMIGGRFVVKDGTLLTLDLAKLADEAEEARDRLDALNAQYLDLYERVAPIVGSFCPGIAARPYHVRRYLCE